MANNICQHGLSLKYRGLRPSLLFQHFLIHNVIKEHMRTNRDFRANLDRASPSLNLERLVETFTI